MHRLCLLYLSAFAVVYGSPEVEDTLNKPLVDLGYAKYQGSRVADGVDQYLGMRYAQPPLGDLRFRAPQDPLPVDGLQEASSVRKRQTFSPRRVLADLLSIVWPAVYGSWPETICIS